MPMLVNRANANRRSLFVVAREAIRWGCIVLSAATVSGYATQSTAVEAPTGVVQRNTLDPGARTSPTPQSLEPRAPSSPRQPPVPATTRMHVLVSTISLPIVGSYPQGYSPKWALVGGHKSVTMGSEDFVASRPQSDKAPASLSLQDINGEPTLVFNIRGLTCMATIVPTGLAVLSAQPAQFQLLKFRRADDRPCAAASRYVRSWAGQMTLSSNLNGDISLQLLLQAYSDRGVLTYRYSLNTVEPNLLTPALAADAVQRDAQRDAQFFAPVPEGFDNSTRRDALRSMFQSFTPARGAADAITAAVRQAIIDDSDSWMVNRLDRASIRNFHFFVSQNDPSTIYVWSLFSYKNLHDVVLDGWATARLKGARVECVFWHDRYSQGERDCFAPRLGYGAQMANLGAGRQRLGPMNLAETCFTDRKRIEYHWIEVPEFAPRWTSDWRVHKELVTRTERVPVQVNETIYTCASQSFELECVARGSPNVHKIDLMTDRATNVSATVIADYNARIQDGTCVRVR